MQRDCPSKPYKISANLSKVCTLESAYYRVHPYKLFLGPFPYEMLVIYTLSFLLYTHLCTYGLGKYFSGNKTPQCLYLTSSLLALDCVYNLKSLVCLCIGIFSNKICDSFLKSVIFLQIIQPWYAIDVQSFCIHLSPS